MKKVGLITHIADVDGAFPIVLANLIFKDIEIISCEIEEVDEYVEAFLKRREEFQKLYIVDVNVSEEMAKKLEQIDVSFVEIFDHHISRENLNIYPFIHVIDSRNGKKECGTTLFYEYLKNHYPNSYLENEGLKELIELVREGDTWDFTDTYKEKANKLGTLYGLYGREEFIARYTNLIKKMETFSFTKEEEFLLEIEEGRIKRYIEEKLEHVKKAVIEGIKVGIVFAEANRSLLGHRMCEEEDIDIAIVIHVNRSVSYRANKEDIDVNTIAKVYGGGGHKHAGGSPLPEHLKEKIIESIFHDVVWK